MARVAYCGSSSCGAAENPADSAQATNGFTTVHAATSDALVAAMLAATASGKPTLIMLAPGTYACSPDSRFCRRPERPAPVTTNIIISGQSTATTSLDNGATGLIARYPTVLASGRLTLRNLTITDGSADCDAGVDCMTNGGGTAGNDGGQLSLENCYLTGNGSQEFPGGDIAYGGAILNVSGILVHNSTITGNRAPVTVRASPCSAAPAPSSIPSWSPMLASAKILAMAASTKAPACISTMRSWPSSRAPSAAISSAKMDSSNHWRSAAAFSTSRAARSRWQTAESGSRLGVLVTSTAAGGDHYPLMSGSPLIDTAGPVGKLGTPRDQIGDPRVNISTPGAAALCDVGAIEFQ